MRQSIEMATGAAMEQIAKSGVIKEHVGGRVGMALKTAVTGAFLAAAMLTAAPAAHAESCINTGGLIGGVIGGIIGSKIGGGTGRLIATGAGAIVGCNAGSNIQDQSQYRQQQQAGYQQQQGYVQAPAYGGNFAPPVVGVSPMGNYMAHTFAQLNGQEAATQPLTMQGKMAVEKVLDEAEQFARQNMDFQQNYANKYEAMRQAQMNSQNPEARAFMGSQLNQGIAQSQNELNQASQARMRANAAFGQTGMKMADLLEYEAARGYDITPYAQRIQGVLSTPMSAVVSGNNPVTHQRASFYTGGAQPQQPQQGYQQRVPGF